MTSTELNMTTKNLLLNLRDLAEQDQPLQMAKFIMGPNLVGPVGMRLEFSSTVFELRVNPDDDTIACNKVLPAGDLSACRCTSALDDLKGLRVFYVWALTNQNGYQDGVEIEFISDDQKTILIRLIAEASELRFLVIPTNTEASG